jgi:uncharacterized protein with von Willebrand factor type A (vWA) domain
VPERFAETLVRFAREVRDAGLTVGSGDIVTYTRSAAVLDPTDLIDLYWSGRATLVTHHDQIRTYHEVFVRFFLDGGAVGDESLPFTASQRTEARAALEVAETESLGEEREGQEARLGFVASESSVSRTKAFAACTPEELATMRRILRTMRLTPPRRRTRRTVPAARGRRPDVRRAVRETMRQHGEPADLYWRGRRNRTRPITFIVDVSGSMADYSRNLVQFAHTSTRTRSRVEVFCFSTRLTRITRELDRRRLDEAMDRAAATVTDWEGGTRIGESIDRFVRDWARTGRCRGGIVVICSDGLDRGDPDVLAAAMERLSRLCHRIVWLNPHKGDRPDFVPNTLGMMVAAPFVDKLMSAHDLASLEEFARTMAEMR